MALQLVLFVYRQKTNRQCPIFKSYFGYVLFWFYVQKLTTSIVCLKSFFFLVNIVLPRVFLVLFWFYVQKTFPLPFRRSSAPVSFKKNWQQPTSFVCLQTVTNTKKKLSMSYFHDFLGHCFVYVFHTFPLPFRRSSSSASFLGSTRDGDWVGGSMLSPPKG